MKNIDRFFRRLFISAVVASVIMFICYTFASRNPVIPISLGFTLFLWLFSISAGVLSSYILPKKNR